MGTHSSAAGNRFSLPDRWASWPTETADGPVLFIMRPAVTRRLSRAAVLRSAPLWARHGTEGQL